MSSSIEEEFNPPDYLSKEEAIMMARQYIRYWKIEAIHANDVKERLFNELGKTNKSMDKNLLVVGNINITKKVVSNMVFTLQVDAIYGLIEALKNEIDKKEQKIKELEKELQ